MKNKKPLIYVMDCGTYNDQMLVSIGANREQIVKYLKKTKCKKEAIAFVQNDEIPFEEIGGAKKGFFAVHPESGFCGIFLSPFLDEWEWYETLLHETHHVTNVLLTKSKNMSDEVEAIAYQQEFLFRSIRRKAQNYYQ